ncbi:MAG: PAS domain S-box protein [Spirochaetaceae bacterium]|nr:MAG: PAS domain S-box protein [Spirochaetaceae bacterium]
MPHDADEPTVRVDLHLHSHASDGYYEPAALADFLSDAGVTFASITDHRSVAGAATFHDAVASRGISTVSGAELHVDVDGAEVHLLAYGFDPGHPAMADALVGTPAAGRAIEAVHEAGGIVCLAHPLNTPWRDGRLEQAVESLAAAGLDGIEAYYQPYTDRQRDRLVALADRLGLLTSGGSDFHGPQRTDTPQLGVDIPASRWRRLRTAIAGRAESGMYGCVDRDVDVGSEHFDAGRINWRWLLARIVLPSVMVIGIFVGLIFAVLIPTMEERLLERKREITTELTNSAWSILADYHRQVEEGRSPLEEAQAAAVERIRRMRYGAEGLDYFWITDLHPRMVMHPYRSDLEGRDLSDFTDPDGVRPFVEFVAAVQNGESGYVTYVWQWQDDPDRLEAKESYVRRFSPWGWIIGTGIYVDDVRREIRSITGRMIDASFLVLVVVVGLLVLVAYQSLKVERRRSAAERDLRLSHERYRALVESAAGGTLLLVNGRCTYANRTLLDALGYSASELAFLDLNDVIATDDAGEGGDQLACLAAGTEVPEPFEAKLLRKSGAAIPVLISATPVFYSGRRGLILSMQDLTRHRAIHSRTQRERLISQLQTSMLFLTEPVRNSMEEPLRCALDTPVSQVVRMMGRNDSGAVLVMGPSAELLGIVTDADIRERVVAASLDPRQPVSRIMSAPVVTIAEHAPLFEASLLERERNVDYLAVVGATGSLVGMVQSSRAVRPDSYSLVVLTQQIRRAGSVEELAECYRRLPPLVVALVESGALARNICHVTTMVSDAIARRVVALATERLGPPPCPFCVVALGSEAREEQTLATDQDNALIYRDPNASEDEIGGAADYFLRLGTEVCDDLNRIGYHHCRGDAMAKNPRWNQPLHTWKGYFDEWITEPDGSAIAHCNVFFDQRAVAGDSALLRDLQQHVREAIDCRPPVLSYLALDTLNYKPPLGAFGKILTGSGGESPGTFNIKEAMLPIVNFARVFALRAQLEQTNTFDRLDALAEIDELSEESHRAVVQAYGALMQLRYRRQTDRVADGLEPDNAIDPRSLTELEIGTVKHAFSQIQAIQKKVSYAFRGAG